MIGESPRLYTVEEYDKLPDPPGGRYELRHGELAYVRFPYRRHFDLRRRLWEMLRSRAEAAGYAADVVYPYRPLPEHELWGADVACVRAERESTITDWLMGSPELVIEIREPEDGDLTVHDKAMTTLAGGAVEFWVVDAETETLKVYSRHSGVRIYREGLVSVPLFDCPISLEALFAE